MDGINVIELLKIFALGAVISGVLVAILLRAFGQRTPLAEVTSTAPDGSPIRESTFFFDGEFLVDTAESWVPVLTGEEAGSSRMTDWARLRQHLAERFDHIPEAPVLPAGEAMRDIAARAPWDPGRLVLRPWRRGLQVILSDRVLDRTALLHEAHRRHAQAERLSTIHERLPLPMWHLGTDGSVTDCNRACREMAQMIGGPERMLAQMRAAVENQREKGHLQTLRLQIDPETEEGEIHWFDLSITPTDTGWQCAAQNVSAMVRSENSQRSFVQTLAKTFAQLSTGLAIFDRDRRLILFNPALMDLTMLSSDFLSARPSLARFFDELRDRQIMPEPKNYASWRDRINALADAAEAGSFQETWSLPSGLTYRIIGRPHPNGATAFLIEDISTEVTMTRQFRQQVSISQSILDTIPYSVVVFSPQGDLGYCNTQYRQLFQLPQDTTPNDLSAKRSGNDWRRACQDPEAIDQLMSRLTAIGQRKRWRAEIQLHDGRNVTCRFVPLPGGASMVGFLADQNREEDETRLMVTQF